MSLDLPGFLTRTGRKHPGTAASPNRPPSNLGHRTLALLWALILRHWIFEYAPLPFEPCGSSSEICKMSKNPATVARTVGGEIDPQSRNHPAATPRAFLKRLSTLQLICFSFRPKDSHKTAPPDYATLQALQGLQGINTCRKAARDVQQRPFHSAPRTFLGFSPANATTGTDAMVSSPNKPLDNLVLPSVISPPWTE